MSYLKSQAEDGQGSWAKDHFVTYIKEVKRLPHFSAAEERDFFTMMVRARPDQKNQLYEELVRRNLMLVVSMAFHYIHKGKKAGLALNDLVQEGNIGLMTAAQKFEPERGTKFSTYAVHWIRQGITRAIADQDEGSGRIPVHVVENMNCARGAWYLAEKKLSREPTRHEVYQIMCDNFKQGLVKRRLTLKQLGTALDYIGLGAPANLDEELDVSHRTLHDMLPQGRPRPDNVIEAKQQLALLRVVIDGAESFVASLKPRSAEVMTLRFGLFGRHVLTLEEVGERYDLTRERIRQIEVTETEKLVEIIGISAGELRVLINVAENLQSYIAGAM
jgi:RNA polymerase primary sigma factor